MTKSKQQIISEEMSRRARLRKNRRGGFNDKVVIAKAAETRRKNREAKKAQNPNVLPETQLLPDQKSRKERQ